MKSTFSNLLVLLVVLVTFSCDEQDAKAQLELPFGGRIESFATNEGVVGNNLNSSIWFFENGCAYLVDDCNQSSIGSFGFEEGKFTFFTDESLLSNVSCDTNKDLVKILGDFNGTYLMSTSNQLTINTESGHRMTVNNSNVVITPLCLMDKTPSK